MSPDFIKVCIQYYLDIHMQWSLTAPSHHVSLFQFTHIVILFQHCKTHSLFSKFCMAILPSHLLFLIPISYQFAPFQYLMICFALSSK